MTLQELQAQALQLTVEERWQLIKALTQSCAVKDLPTLPPSPSAKPLGLVASLIGIAKTDAPPPTDDEVAAMLDERLVQKYL
jgi:hypothetical protein